MGISRQNVPCAGIPRSAGKTALLGMTPIKPSDAGATAATQLWNPVQAAVVQSRIGAPQADVERILWRGTASEVAEKVASCSQWLKPVVKVTCLSQH